MKKLKLRPNVESYSLRVCKVCGAEKPSILFDGCGGANTCKDCANKRAQEQRKQKRKAWGDDRKCESCNKLFTPYTSTQKVCSTKCGNRLYKTWQFTNPIKHRAFILGNSLVGLKDKIGVLTEMLNESVGKECKYCNEIISLSTASLDHMIPLERNKSLTKEKKILLNQRDNLQIICRKCNTVKSNFTDKEYMTIMDVCKLNPELGMKLLKRLSQSNNIWRRKTH